MGTGETIALAILLVGYLLYAHGPEQDGPLKRQSLVLLASGGLSP